MKDCSFLVKDKTNTFAEQLADILLQQVLEIAVPAPLSGDLPALKMQGHDSQYGKLN